MDAHAETSTSGAPGPLAGRYELGEPLGRGRSTVYRATDTRLQRQVAVKRVELLAGLEDADRVRARALREAQAAARLNNPCVVTVYDVVEEDEAIWLVMELVPAPSLSQVVVDQGPLAHQRAARIGLDVLSALEAAHAVGVVHRDVKPANVLVTAGDRAKLTDFGVATIRDESRLTATGLIVGSPSYMAPEQARGADVGPPTDLWALGTLLYFATEGEPPFQAGSALATASAVVNGDPRPARHPGELARAIAALLTKDPASRPTHRTVRAELQRVSRTTRSHRRAAPYATTAVTEPADPTPVATPPPPPPQPTPPSPPPTSAGLAWGTARPPDQTPAPAAETPAPVEPPATPSAPGADEPTAAPAAEADGPTAAPMAEADGPDTAAPAAAADRPDTSAPATADEPDTAMPVAEGDGPDIAAPVAEGDGPDIAAPPAGGDEPRTVARAAEGDEPEIAVPVDGPRLAAPATGADMPRAVPAASRVDPDVPPHVLARARAGSRSRLVVLGVAAAAVLLVAVAVAALRGDGGGGTGDLSSSTETTAAPTTAAPTETPTTDIPTTAPTAPGTLPAGWSAFRDDAAGYTIGYPPGWQVVPAGGPRTDFRDPATGAYLRVDWTATPGDDPVAAWREQAPGFARRHDGYQEIGIGPATFRDYDAGLWEFTYDAGGPVHVANLGFVTGGKGYALYFQVPEDQWAASQPLLEQFRQAFLPG